jgi:hypothetical protein
MIQIKVKENKVVDMIDSQNVHENYVIINGDADISVGDDIRFFNNDHMRLSVEEAIEARVLETPKENYKTVWRDGEYKNIPDFSRVLLYDIKTKALVQLREGESPDWNSVTDKEYKNESDIFVDGEWVINEEAEQKEKSERLKAEILELELKQLRSLKAIMSNATEEDEKIYNEIEAEIQAKREEIRGLEKGENI